jgi:hypothetical protein
VRNPTALIAALRGDGGEHGVPSIMQLGVVQIPIDVPVAADLGQVAILKRD